MTFLRFYDKIYIDYIYILLMYLFPFFLSAIAAILASIASARNFDKQI